MRVWYAKYRSHLAAFMAGWDCAGCVVFAIIGPWVLAVVFGVGTGFFAWLCVAWQKQANLSVPQQCAP